MFAVRHKKHTKNRNFKNRDVQPRVAVGNSVLRFPLLPLPIKSSPASMENAAALPSSETLHAQRKNELMAKKTKELKVMCEAAGTYCTFLARSEILSNACWILQRTRSGASKISPQRSQTRRRQSTTTSTRGGHLVVVTR